MSRHYGAPNFAFPRGGARLDYTDLYAFPKPGDPSKSILIMDVPYKMSEELKHDRRAFCAMPPWPSLPPSLV